MSHPLTPSALALATLALACSAVSAYAVCPNPPLTLCQIVQRNEWVLLATVESRQVVKDEDDPEGVAGWIYHLTVRRDYRNNKVRHISVFSENTTSRVVLQPGKEYFVFAGRNPGQMPETGNYCDKYTQSPYSVTIEREILSCLHRNKRNGS
jgi:hypothetical protein